MALILTFKKERKSIVRWGLYSSFFLWMSLLGSANAQQRISADVTTRQVAKNKVIRIERQLFYTVGGDLVSHYTYPQEYYMKSNRLGEIVIYQPSTNEVTMINDKEMSEQSEVMLQFFSPDRSNLNLTRMGFALQKTEKQGNRIVKTFTPTLLEDKKKMFLHNSTN